MAVGGAVVSSGPSRASAPVTSLAFFARLKWIDGRSLLDTIEQYRRDLFTRALDTYGADGRPAVNLVVAGRAKKNWKTADLVLAALYVLCIRESAQGSDGFILANDSDQAGDDLALARKLVACNPDLSAEIEPLADELRLRDGSATLKILPAKDVAGAHGKTAAFIGFDEIHGYRDWALLEALAPDPTRPDALTWVTSYASIYNVEGAPLHDLMRLGQAGADGRGAGGRARDRGGCGHLGRPRRGTAGAGALSETTGRELAGACRRRRRECVRPMGPGMSVWIDRPAFFGQFIHRAKRRCGNRRVSLEARGG